MFQTFSVLFLFFDFFQATIQLLLALVQNLVQESPVKMPLKHFHVLTVFTKQEFAKNVMKKWTSAQMRSFMRLMRT